MSSSTYLQTQALKFIKDIDRTLPQFQQVNWSASKDALIPQVAQACRSAIICVEVKPVAKILSPRIARPNESVDALFERCSKGTWRSVGLEYQFPNGLDYCNSPDPVLNSPGIKFGEWTWQINRHHEWQFLAQQYHQSKKEKYAQAVSTWLRNWLEQCPCPDEDRNAHQGPWRTIEIGIRLGSIWPQILSAFIDSPSFSDELILAWLQSYAEQSAFVYRYRKQNNWLLMEMNGLMHAGVQITVHQNSTLWRQQASDTLVAETSIQFHPDGIQRELSASYHGVCFYNYMRAVQALQVGGHPIDSRLENCIRNMLKPCRALARPNGYLFDFQDSHALNLKGLLKQVPQVWHEDGDSWFLQDEPPTTKSAISPPPQNNHVLLNAGYAVLRSGYQVEDLCVAFDGGPFGDAHQHEDKLSIQVHAYGQDLIGEAGIVDYSDSPERHYSLSTLAHSTAIVDGLGQHRKTQYYKNRPSIDAVATLEYDLSTAQPWARAVFNEGYGTDELHLLQHSRTVVLISKTEVQLIDHFTKLSKTTHQVEILFHCMKADASLKGDHFTSIGAGANVEISWSCEQTAIAASLVCGGKEPDLRGWAAPDDHSNGLYAVIPRPCLTLKLDCTQDTKVITTLRITAPQT